MPLDTTVHSFAHFSLALVLGSSVALAQGGTRLVREVAIGDASVPKGLTSLGVVAVGPGKRLYVAQPQDNIVLMFDSAGKYVRAIGGKGDGPGETQALSSIGFVGDTLWTTDWRAGRFAFFSIDGTYISMTRPASVVDSALRARGITLTASTPLQDGTFYFGGLTLRSRIGAGIAPPIMRVIATRDGGIVRSVGPSDSIGRGSFAFATADRQMFTTDPFFSQLFDRSPLLAIGGNGAWFVVARRDECNSQTRYTVAKVSLRGDTTWRAMIDCPQLAVTPRFIDSVVAANVERFSKMQIPAPEAEKQVRPQLGLPKVFTPARAIMIGDDGSIWIRPFVAPVDVSMTWFRVDGGPNATARFTLPPKAELKAIVDASHVWAQQLNDDDLPTLVRYRLVPLSTGDRQ